METGLSDILFTGSSRDGWLEKAHDADAGLIRVFVSWRQVATNKPSDPQSPSDSAYDFSGLDATVAGIAANGMEPLLTVYDAPAWAEGKNRPKSAYAGTWKPSASAFGKFNHALAARYSGSFNGLPRVRYFQAWNEPNLDNYLSPQWKGKKLVAADAYKSLMGAAYKAIHGVDSGNRLVGAGLAPYGASPGGDRSRPLKFWRSVFCLKDRKKLKKAGNCGKAASLDIFAHHAINTSGPPPQEALNPDDASSGDLKDVARVFKAAERQGTVAGGKHPMWVTEFWWESDPPDRKQGYPPMRQAQFIEQTMFLAWDAGFSAAINLQIRDERVTKKTVLAHNATGLYFHSNKAKPALRAFEFPFVADRKSKKIELWGKAPSSGKVVVEQKKGKGWKKVESTKAGSNRIFDTKTRLGGRAKLRAKAGGETSLVWKLK